HLRAIIYYNFQRQLSQQECLAELLSVFANEAPHQSTISRWYGEVKRGRVGLSDHSRVGAPKTEVTQENVAAVRKLIIEDRHVTYREIEAIILHQGNASSHTAQKTRQYLTTPNDFFTFPKIKNRLGGQRLKSPEEAVDAFKNAALDLSANEWNNCFENLFERMQMCINLRGEYFEKQ
ncbi:unnamed protein product, partial [Acanthoscelides obtectus]